MSAYWGLDMGNSFKDLNRAKANKKDEFYTRLVDIELEMRNYRDFFKGKSVFCNCDDPYESNFFKYFSMNFNYLGLKKLVATCYGTSPIVNTQLNIFNWDCNHPADTSIKEAYKIEITEVEDLNADGAIDLSDVKQLISNNKNVLTMLKGDGDFRSEECIELLKDCDIVVTNPPFSLFRSFIATLTQYDKDFIIIGNTNSLTYKELFPLIRKDRARTGYTNFNKGSLCELFRSLHCVSFHHRQTRVGTLVVYSIYLHSHKRLPPHYQHTFLQRHE